MSFRKILLGGGMLLALWLALFADKTPDGDVVDAVSVPVKKTAIAKPDKDAKQSDKSSGKPLDMPSNLLTKPGHANETQVIASIIDRKQLIAADYKGNGSFFGTQSWTPPPPPATKPPPPPPPTAPPLPFHYLGKKTEDGPVEVYLASGDQTYVVQEKTVIDNIYRVDAIKPSVMSITYLPLNQVQTLHIGRAE